MNLTKEQAKKDPILKVMSSALAKIKSYLPSLHSGPPRGIPIAPSAPWPRAKPKVRVRGASLTEPRVLVNFGLHGSTGSFPDCYEAFPTLAAAKEAMDRWMCEGDPYGPSVEIVNAFYKAGDEIGADWYTPNISSSRFDPTLSPDEMWMAADANA